MKAQPPRRQWRTTSAWKAFQMTLFGRYPLSTWINTTSRNGFRLRIILLLIFPIFLFFTIFSVFFGIHVISKTRQINDRAKKLTITWWSEKLENYAQQGRRQSEHVLEAAWWRAKAWNGKKNHLQSFSEFNSKLVISAITFVIRSHRGRMTSPAWSRKSTFPLASF